jgi:hypothetical protein
VQEGRTQAVDEQSTASPDGVPLKVFINYRRADTDAAALLLYDRLARHFGPDNVFLDVKTLEVGTRWLQEIIQRGAHSAVFLALIGRAWLGSLKERQPRAAQEPHDFVALELELALGRWPGRVIPVLVGGAAMPAAVELPRPLRQLAACQAVELRHRSFDEDVEQLIASLSTLPEPRENASAEAATVPADRSVSHSESQASAPHPQVTTSARAASIPPPDAAHYETVLACMVEEGTVVPVLGSRMRGALPDAEQLAAHLATRFKLGSESLDLAQLAQRVAVAEGPSFLHRAMKDALRLEPEPNDVQRFLARFPRRLEQLGRPPRHQMIVTTSYDTSLERAFDAEGEAYDVAVFVASRADKGTFVHVPWRGEPQMVTEAGKYRDFPIDPYDELERAVIVKVLGAAEGGEGGYRWDRSYVLTEDQYIDYLVTDEIGSVVPLQILNKLTSSHCLFLGYAMRDWTLRVFLKRIWRGRPLEDKSWAIEHEPDPLEKDFWNSLRVELLAALPGDYAKELDLRMQAWSAAGA